MTYTSKRKTPVTIAALLLGSLESTRIRCGLQATAVACVLLSTNLWAEQPKVESTSAIVPTAATQASDPAAAASEKPILASVQPVNPLAGWKPPKMPEIPPFSTQKIDPEVAKALKERWGVELLGIRRTAAGMFLDFRFKVLDAEKSLPLFDHRIKPHIMAERSNIKLPVPMAPKVGAFRPTNRGKNIKADRIYYMMFGNPDRHVKAGEKVTVVIGDFKVEHLIVN